VHATDQLRLFEQDFGRPERIVERGAAALKLGRERAIQNQDRLLREKFGDWITDAPLYRSD
jgi:hypothetical protein